MADIFTTCSVSGMSIINQKVARILLVPSKYMAYRDLKKEDFDSRTFFKRHRASVYGEYGTATFSPFGYPIIGEFDNATQNLNNIQKSAFTKDLEKIFGVKINDFFDELNSYQRDNNDSNFKQTSFHGILDRLTYTDVRLEIYNYLSLKNLNTPNPLMALREQHYGSFLNTLCFDNYYNNSDVKMAVELNMLKAFMTSLGDLHINLMPSNAGSQGEPNWHDLIALNNFSNQLMQHDLTQINTMTTFFLYQKYKYTGIGKVQCFDLPTVFTKQQFLNYLQRECRLDVGDYTKIFNPDGEVEIRLGNYLHLFKQVEFGIKQDDAITAEQFCDTHF
jgi:hypothetical protein